jgi:hypothetical protein
MTYQATKSLEHLIRSSIRLIGEVSCKKNVIPFAIPQLFIGRRRERVITVLPVQLMFMSPPKFHPRCSRVMGCFSCHVSPESNKIQRALSSVIKIVSKHIRVVKKKHVLPIGHESHQKINVLLRESYSFPGSASEQ